MKLLTIKKNNRWTLGVKLGEQIVDIEAAKKVLPHTDVPAESVCPRPSNANTAMAAW